MTWAEELDAIAREAAGDVGLLCGLIALRHTEHGGPGREFGVLSTPAPTYQDQCHVAAVSLRHQMALLDAVCVVRDPWGFLTDDFLTRFSHHWAPLDANNDPHGLNANHARNLTLTHKDASGALRAAIQNLS